MRTKAFRFQEVETTGKLGSRKIFWGNPYSHVSVHIIDIRFQLTCLALALVCQPMIFGLSPVLVVNLIGRTRKIFLGCIWLLIFQWNKVQYRSWKWRVHYNDFSVADIISVLILVGRRCLQKWEVIKLIQYHNLFS